MRVRFDDNDKWSETQYFKTKGRRDKVGAINRIIGGIRTHSFEETKTEAEIEEIFFE